MSLDGYIAKDDNTIGRLFDWLQNGDVEVPTVSDRITFHMSPASAAYWRRWRRWVRCAGLWAHAVRLHRRVGRTHTMDVPVVVVTHEVPTDWVEAHPVLRSTSSPTAWRPRSRRHRSSPATTPSR